MAVQWGQWRHSGGAVGPVQQQGGHSGPVQQQWGDTVGQWRHSEDTVGQWRHSEDTVGTQCRRRHPDPYHGHPPQSAPCPVPTPPGTTPPRTTTPCTTTAHHEDRCHTEHWLGMSEIRKLTPMGAPKNHYLMHSGHPQTCLA